MNKIQEIEAELELRMNLERDGTLTAPSLERMELLIDVMGRLDETSGVMSITGTNGKSTAAMAASSLAHAAGLRVGTYMSPHVSSFAERIREDLEPIPARMLTDGWEELAPILDFVDTRGAGRITWFEAVTALAFTVFADRGVELAVLEVGMGGRWDATNVVDALTALALPVGSDHPVLGATPVEKAREKAGIVKEGATLLLCSQLEDGVREVFEARCKDVGAEIVHENEAWELVSAKVALAGQAVRLRLGEQQFDDLFIPMFGEHSARAAVAGLAASWVHLGRPELDEETVTEALARVQLPGRLEVASRKPLLLVDGAHNPEAALAVAGTLPKAFRYDKLVVIAACMADKDVEALIRPLALLADRVIATSIDHPRAADPQRIADAAVAAGCQQVETAETPAEALTLARALAGEHDAILAAGSLYLAGEIRAATGLAKAV